MSCRFASFAISDSGLSTRSDRSGAFSCVMPVGTLAIYLGSSAAKQHESQALFPPQAGIAAARKRGGKFDVEIARLCDDRVIACCLRLFARGKRLAGKDKTRHRRRRAFIADGNFADIVYLFFGKPDSMTVMGEAIAPVARFLEFPRHVACIETCKRGKDGAVKAVHEDR